MQDEQDWRELVIKATQLRANLSDAIKDIRFTEPKIRPLDNPVNNAFNAKRELASGRCNVLAERMNPGASAAYLHHGGLLVEALEQLRQLCAVRSMPALPTIVGEVIDAQRKANDAVAANFGSDTSTGQSAATPTIGGGINGRSRTGEGRGPGRTEL